LSVLSRFKNHALKRFARLLVEKELLAIVASADDEVNGARVFDMLLAQHFQRLRCG
jgi:hypothetical protein